MASPQQPVRWVRHGNDDSPRGVGIRDAGLASDTGVEVKRYIKPARPEPKWERRSYPRPSVKLKMLSYFLRQLHKEFRET